MSINNINIPVSDCFSQKINKQSDIKLNKISFGTATNINYAKELTNDSFVSSNAIADNLMNELKETKKKQGLVGKIWDGFKNIVGMKSGSNAVDKVIKQFKNGEISEEEAKTSLKNYQEGQKMCLDVFADVVSGIVSVMSFSAAVVTGGMSIPLGLAISTGASTMIKCGIKAGDAYVMGREYTGKDLLHDSVTGAVNGLFAPVTNGIGASLTKTVGKKLGLTIVKEGTKTAIKQGSKQGVKSAIRNTLISQNIDVAGGTIAKRTLALGIGMAADGAIGGATDNMARAALSGENVFKAGVKGAIGGAIAAPIIGGGIRISGKAINGINNKITMKKILPDGINTKFKQGQVGDCALLSTIDGMMSNSKTAKLIKKSITKTMKGDYRVKIGDNIVTVAKTAITDEMLSDSTGIKIFEQAYKQVAGDLDGGFAEIVAKQFGLNPVHLANEVITDDILSQIAKEQDNFVLSLGLKIDADGAISSEGLSNHYFSVKKIDDISKKVILTSPIDTSKTIELSYDEVKKLGISLDGGSVKKSNIKSSPRNADDIMFRGIDSSSYKKTLKTSDVDIDDLLRKTNLTPDELIARLRLSGISENDFALAVHKHGFDSAVKNIETYDILRQMQLFEGSKMTLDDASNIMQYLDNVINKGGSINPEELLTGYEKTLFASGVADEDKMLDILCSRELNYNGAKELYDKCVTQIMQKQINPDFIVNVGQINGKGKVVVCQEPLIVNASRLSQKSLTEKFILDLCESNLITRECVDVCNELYEQIGKNIDLSKLTCAVQYGNGIVTEVKFEQLLRRATEDISTLNNSEIHALTKFFKDVIFKENNGNLSNLGNLFMKSLKNKLGDTGNASLDYGKIAGMVKAMSDSANAVTKKKITFRDHAFMRLIDRNIINPMDINGRTLSFQELIELTEKAVKNNQTVIKGVYSNEGKEIQIIVNRKGSVPVVESFM